MESIEDKIKLLEPNKCRGCEHYIRVNFDSMRNVMNRQGFCVLGQLSGNYELYISTSASRECMGFIFSEKNFNIMQAEQLLDRDLDNYLHYLEDKRTKQYKDFEPLLKADQKLYETINNQPRGLAWMSAMMQIRGVACEHYKDLHIEKFHEVYDMVTLMRSDYSKFLAQVSVKIHDQFCNCQSIEFKDNKVD